jgi:hypothetical protein
MQRFLPRLKRGVSSLLQDEKPYNMEWWHVLDIEENRIVAGSEDRYEVVKDINGMISQYREEEDDD